MSENVVAEIKKKPKKIIRIYDVDYPVENLTWGMSRKFNEKGEGKADNEEWLHEMLVSLGLPGDVLLEMEPEDIELIVSALMPTKKK